MTNLLARYRAWRKPPPPLVLQIQEPAASAIQSLATRTGHPDAATLIKHALAAYDALHRNWQPGAQLVIRYNGGRTQKKLPMRFVRGSRDDN